MPRAEEPAGRIPNVDGTAAAAAALVQAARDRPRGAFVVVAYDHAALLNALSPSPAGHAIGRRVAEGLAYAAGQDAPLASVAEHKIAALIDCADEMEAHAVAAHVLRRLRADVEPGHPAGAGIAWWGTEQHAQHALAAAGLAAHEATSGDGPEIVRGQPDLDAVGSGLGALRDALTHRRLSVEARPIVELASGRVHARVVTPRLAGHPAAADIRALAARFGLRSELDLAVARRALELARRGEAVWLPIAADLAARSALSAFERLLIDAPPRPGALTLALGRSPGTAIDRFMLRELARRGVGLALEDLDSSGEALALMRDLPIGAATLDGRSWLSGGVRAAPRALLEGLVALVDGVGADLVATGLHEPVAAERAVAAGIRLGAGRIFDDAPSPADHDLDLSA